MDLSAATSSISGALRTTAAGSGIAGAIVGPYEAVAIKTAGAGVHANKPCGHLHPEGTACNDKRYWVVSGMFTFCLDA